MKLALGLTSILSIILLTLFIVDKYQFPIVMSVCTKLYEDCRVVARYDTMYNCQSDSEKGNWLCDSQTDPENIICKPSHNSFAVSFCSKK